MIVHNAWQHIVNTFLFVVERALDLYYVFVLSSKPSFEDGMLKLEKMEELNSPVEEHIMHYWPI